MYRALGDILKLPAAGVLAMLLVAISAYGSDSVSS